MDRTLDIIKALADRNRLRVVISLMENNELCVCQIKEMLKISYAAVSKHMSILFASGLAQGRKEGKWVFYSLSGSFPALIREWIEQEMDKFDTFETDRINLKKILSCTPEDLCRSKK